MPWTDALAWVKARGPWVLPKLDPDVAVPEYYREPFHAYESGNLCWEAAFEGEIASRAVGARNFPAAGADGELAFRGAFDDALGELGAAVPRGGAVIDFGCASGISTRRIAANWPGAASVLGLDLSPHFVAVGRRLHELAAPRRRPRRRRKAARAVAGSGSTIGAASPARRRGSGGGAARGRAAG